MIKYIRAFFDSPWFSWLVIWLTWLVFVVFWDFPTSLDANSFAFGLVVAVIAFNFPNAMSFVFKGNKNA